MTKDEIHKKYSIFDGKIETYCIYQGCHWTVPALDLEEATFLSENSKIVQLAGQFGLQYVACEIERNALGFVSATFYTHDDAYEALIERILRENA